MLLIKDLKNDNISPNANNTIPENTKTSHFATPYNNLHYDTKINEQSQPVKTSVVIVPHHLLAGGLINDTLSKIDSNYETIILIGPNHKDIGKYPVQISSSSWQTKFGEIKPNLELINNIEKTEQVNILEDYFDLEHSICGLVTFIKKYFPEANILPIILRSDVRQDNIKQFSKILSSECERCLVIASVDFSHEVSENISVENDANSIKLLEEKNSYKLGGIISDCNRCIEFTYAFLEAEEKFILVNNSSSYKISGENEESVTSYIAGYYAK